MARAGLALAIVVVVASACQQQPEQIGECGAALSTTDAFPVPVSAGTSVFPAVDDAYAYVPFTDGFTFPFYGQVYEGVYINTNGGMTFGGGVPDYDLAADEVAFPTIAVFWGDLDPSRHGAETRPRQLRWWQYRSCFEVRYEMLQDYDEPTWHNSARVLLADDGVIAVEYGTVLSEDILVGVFDGTHADDRRLAPAEEFAMSEHGTGIILFDYWHDPDDRHEGALSGTVVVYVP